MKHAKTVIMALLLVIVAIQLYQLINQREKYDVNLANCQGNAYNTGCVWGAQVGGTQYDWSSFCSC